MQTLSSHPRRAVRHGVFRPRQGGPVYGVYEERQGLRLRHVHRAVEADVRGRKNNKGQCSSWDPRLVIA